jgi:hypothetical protein
MKRRITIIEDDARDILGLMQGKDQKHSGVSAYASTGQIGLSFQSKLHR